MTEHTTKAFDVDLQDLSRLVAEMGGLAEKNISDAVEALDKRDTALAQRIVALDGKIDMLQREIEEKAVLTIARRQPMAVDLRDVVGALRVANDLERIGDLAKNIAKRVTAIDGDLQLQKVMRGVACVSRSAGLVGHIYEESQKPSGAFIWETVDEAIPYTE